MIGSNGCDFFSRLMTETKQRMNLISNSQNCCIRNGTVGKKITGNGRTFSPLSMVDLLRRLQRAWTLQRRTRRQKRRGGSLLSTKCDWAGQKGRGALMWVTRSFIGPATVLIAWNHSSVWNRVRSKKKKRFRRLARLCSIKKSVAFLMEKYECSRVNIRGFQEAISQIGPVLFRRVSRLLLFLWKTLNNLNSRDPNFEVPS